MAEQENFWSIWGEHEKRLYDFIFTSARNHADAQDILHATAIRAIASWKDLRSEDSAGSWLMTVAMHCAADYYRKTRREKSMDVADVERLIAKYDGIDTDAMVLRQFLDELPADWRMAFLLRWHYGYSMRFIAKQMDFNYHKLYRTLKKAKNTLADMLSEDEGHG